VLEREGPLVPERAIRIAQQIAEGLAAAHDVDIVHRDLKPDNVVLVERDQAEFVKILDFGLAKVARPQGRLTRVGKIFGTPHYMSPEQSRGKPVDQRTDVYALGVILYEMLSGRVPFEGDTPLTILSGHVHGDVRPLRAQNSSARTISAELEAVVLKCLAKRPEDRYPSMRALFADLELVEQGQVPEAFRERAKGEQDLGNVEALLASLEELDEEEEVAHVLIDADDESDTSLGGVDEPESAPVDTDRDAQTPFANGDEAEATLVDSEAPPADDEASPEAIPPPEAKPKAPSDPHPRLWPLGMGVLVLLGVVALLFSRVRHELGPATNQRLPSAETELVGSASAPALSGELPASLPSEPVASAAAPVEVAGEPMASTVIPLEAISTSPTTSRWVMIATEPEDAEIYSRGVKLGTPPLPIEVRGGEPIPLEARRHGYWPNRFKIDGSKSRVFLRMAPILKQRPAVPEAVDLDRRE
jgi:hypothetical protein